MLEREIQVVNGKKTLIRNALRTGWMSRVGGEVPGVAERL